MKDINKETKPKNSNKSKGNLVKAKVARILTSGVFWMPIIVAYFGYRNITLENSYFLVSFYSICIVALEYPTGVIGDYFSHHLSLKVGYFLISAAFMLLGFQATTLYYGIILFIAALGVSLVSGSDDAVLISVSEDFDNDFREIKTIATVFSIIAIALGGIFYKIYPSLPFFASSASFFFSFTLVMLLKIDNGSTEVRGNVFDKAFESLRFIQSKEDLRFLLIYTSVVSAFFVSSKWFYNPLFASAGIDEAFYGLSVAVLTLLNAFGTKISKKFRFRYWQSSTIFLAMLALTGFLTGSIFLILPLMVLFVLRGVLETQLMIKINKRLNSNIRASVVSFKNLIMRLVSALYLALAGMGVEKTGLGRFLVLTAFGMLFIFGTNYFFMKRTLKAE